MRDGKNSNPIVGLLKSPIRLFIPLLLALLLAIPTPLPAIDELEYLLALPEPPDGVVFEIVEADENALEEMKTRLKICCREYARRSSA